MIDFHSHFYPKAYMDELSKPGGYARVEKDKQGRLLIHYEGDYNVVVGPHVDISDRLADMDRHGVETHVLTLTTPSVERENSQKGIKLAKLANDGFSEICEKHPSRFVALAALPLQDPAAAADELERSVRDLGLRGGTLMSNVAGKPLDLDLQPVYDRAVKLDVPLFIHPTSPINTKYLEDYRLVPIMGFGHDTSLSVLRMVFSGLFEKMPRLKIVASHLGGIYPYLRGRINTGYNAYPECKANIKKPPTEYLKRVWVDSLIYDADVFRSTLAFLGPEKIVLGSDHPHQIGDIGEAHRRIKGLKLTTEAEDAILTGNATELLKL
jgi:aminocarboxymuconate-semialdehyde decarboxylase